MNIRYTTKMICLVALGIVAVAFAARPSQAQSVQGVIADRYNQTGGAAGPLGSVTSNEMPATDGRGRYNLFQNGMIAFSSPTGPKSTQVIYRKGGKVYFQWGTTDPFSYGRFIVRWTINNGATTQIDVNGQGMSGDNYTARATKTDGTLSLTLGSKDSISIIVEGADNGTFGTIARQGWSTPVWVGTPPGVPPPPPTPPAISVSATGASATAVFTVTGTGFLPNSAVTIRIVDDALNPLVYKQNATKIGQLQFTHAIPCNGGFYLAFSATDGRSDPHDKTGSLWSNTFRILCPGTTPVDTQSLPHKSSRKIGALTHLARTPSKSLSDIPPPQENGGTKTKP